MLSSQRDGRLGRLFAVRWMEGREQQRLKEGLQKGVRKVRKEKFK